MAYIVRIQLGGDVTSFECEPDEYIMDAAENAGVSLPYECRAGACYACACGLADGAVDQSDVSILTKEQIERGFVMPCVSRPLSNVSLVANQRENLPNGSPNRDLVAIVRPGDDDHYYDGGFVWGDGTDATEIDTNGDALRHYFNGNGETIPLSKRAQELIKNARDIQDQLKKNMSGTGIPPYAVKLDLTLEDGTFHLGKTAAQYTEVCKNGVCTTTFTAPQGAKGPDRFEDPLDISERLSKLNIEIAPVEVLGGKPYSYETFSWSYTYLDPRFKK